MPKTLAHDDPLSILRDALVSVLGGIFGFLLVCWVPGALLAISMAILGSDRFDLEFDGVLGALALVFPGVPLLWLFGAVEGVSQVWGLLSYVFLGFAFVYHVYGENASRPAIVAAYLIQSVETLRCFLHREGWQYAGSPGVIAYAVASAAVGGTLVAMVFRHRRRKALLE